MLSIAYKKIPHINGNESMQTSATSPLQFITNINSQALFKLQESEPPWVRPNTLRGDFKVHRKKELKDKISFSFSNLNYFHINEKAERQNDRSVAGSLPACVQQHELGQDKTSRQQLNLSSRALTRSLPEYAKEAGSKERNQDLNQALFNTL